MFKSVGNRLKAVIKSRGLTNIGLATKLGISRNRLAGILADKQELDFFDMKALRKALTLTPEEAIWVFFPEEENTAQPAWL